MKIISLKKIENASLQYDIQTGTQNFFANGVLVHNSMVTPIWYDGGIKFKTKKTFASAEAMNADKIAAETPGGLDWIKLVLQQGRTPTFEMTSPKFPIVLVYEKDELTILHVRENVSGRYLSEAEIQALNPPFPIVENVMEQFIGAGVPANVVSWQKLQDYALTATGVEGVVIQLGQEMVKLKTAWYCELHRSVTFTRWRDVARSVVSDSSDDLKGAFALTGRDIEPIIRVERTIKAKTEAAAWEVDCILRVHADLDAKGLALLMKGHPLFGQIMSSFRGKEIDWMAWYAKNHLDQDWSLEVIPTNSGDVDEQVEVA